MATTNITSDVIDEHFCASCFSARELIETVEKYGEITDVCRICAKTQVKSLPANDPFLKRVFRALIRVNYSEWQYNHHLGGDSLSGLLFGRNSIMDFDGAASEEEFQNAFTYIEDTWYPESDGDISLGGGYWDARIHESIKNRIDYSLSNLIVRGFRENYFTLQEDVTHLFDRCLSDISTSLPEESHLYRARIGVKKRLQPIPPDFDPYCMYLPYTGSDISSPPIHLASEGRLNRSRVSILYLSSDRETAVTEVRPHPGHLVSTAVFESVKSLKIADLDTQDVRNYLSDARLKQLRTILSFNSLMNLPVTPERREYYLITQLLSDCVREAGFDGVKFNSSLGPGSNYAFFDSANFVIQTNSERVLAVKSLNYHMEEVPFVYQNYDADDYNEDEDDPFSTLYDVLSRHK